MIQKDVTGPKVMHVNGKKTKGNKGLGWQIPDKTVSYDACCVQRFSKGQTCGKAVENCQFKPVKKKDCNQSRKDIPICRKGVQYENDFCRADEGTTIANYKKINETCKGWPHTRIFQLRCARPMKNWQGVVRNSTSKCTGIFGMDGACGLDEIGTNLATKFGAPKAVTNVLGWVLDAVSRANALGKEINDAICLGDWPVEKQAKNASLQNWEDEVAKPGGLADYGCKTVLAAGDKGKVSGFGLVVPLDSFVPGAPKPDFCFATNKCDGKYSFAMGAGPGTSKAIFDMIPALAPIFGSAGPMEVSFAMGFSAGGHYRTPITYFNGEKDEKIMMESQLYISTAAEFGGWTDIICDFLGGDKGKEKKKRQKKACKKSGKCAKKKKSKKSSYKRRELMMGMDFSYLIECDLTGAADPLLGDELDKVIQKNLGFSLKQPDLEIIVVEAAIGAYFGFAGDMDDVKNCLFGDKDCDPLQMIVDSSFAVTVEGTLGVDLEKIASYLPKLNVKVNAQILKTNIGLYTGLKVSILEALTPLCNDAFAKMTIPLTCPELSVGLNFWITNKDIGFKFTVIGFDIGCKFIYANGHISCHVGYGAVKFWLTIAVSMRAVEADVGGTPDLQQIADAVHNPKKLVIVEDCCEDCLTGVVIHAGDETPDEVGEPVVDGTWSDVKHVEDRCKNMGDDGKKIIEHIEKTMIDKMKKESNPNPKDSSRRRLHTSYTSL